MSDFHELITFSRGANRQPELIIFGEIQNEDGSSQAIDQSMTMESPSEKSPFDLQQIYRVPAQPRFRTIVWKSSPAPSALRAAEDTTAQSHPRPTVPTPPQPAHVVPMAEQEKV